MALRWLWMDMQCCVGKSLEKTWNIQDMQSGDCQICKYLLETALTAAQKSLKFYTFLWLKCFDVLSKGIKCGCFSDTSSYAHDFMWYTSFPKWIMKMKANDILNFPRNSVIGDCGRIKAYTWPLNEKTSLIEKRKRNRRWRRAEALIYERQSVTASVGAMDYQWACALLWSHWPKGRQTAGIYT